MSILIEVTKYHIPSFNVAPSAKHNQTNQSRSKELTVLVETWCNCKIRPSTWCDVNKEYLPYPTYIYLGGPYKKRWSDKQSQSPTNICHGHTVQITSYREYINIFVCKRLRIFLTYTVLLVSSGETSRPQHINLAQSTLCVLPTTHVSHMQAQNL